MRTATMITALAAALFSGVTPAAAATGDASAVMLLGRWAEGGSHAAALDGTMGYCGQGSYFQVLDVSDPTTPAPLGRVLLPGPIFDLLVDGTVVYASVKDDGVFVIDVSTPVSPAILGSFAAFGTAYDLALEGTTLYAAQSWYGLYTIDVSDPSNPTQLGFFPANNQMKGVAVSGTHAYVADFVAGVTILDVSDPSAPVQIASLDNDYALEDCVVSGTTLFLADWYEGLITVDVSDPTAPVELAREPVWYSRGIDLIGTTAYLATGSYGVSVFDVSNVLDPVLLADVPTGGWVDGIGADGTRVLAADTTTGINVVDVTAPGSPVIEGTYTTAGLALDVATVDQIAYVAHGNAGLRVLDVSNPAVPTEIGHLSIGTQVNCVATKGSYAYLGGNGSPGLGIVDISQPSSPTLVAELGGLAGNEIAVRGDYAYVAQYNTGVRVIDISSPTNPLLVASLPLSVSTRSITLDGDLAYVSAYGDGLRILDITDPTMPVEVGSWEGGQVWDTVVSDGTAFVASSGKLTVLDVSTPEAPVQLFQDTAGTFVGLTLTEGRLLCGGATSGLRIFDITDPLAPSLIGYYDTGDYAYEPAFAGNHMIVPDGNSGVWILSSDLVVPVVLASFTASRAGGSAELAWEISRATGSAGFHIHREGPGGVRRQITDTLIPGSGAATYTFVDESPTSQAADYWLEEVAVDGSRSFIGSTRLPAAVSPGIFLARQRPNPFNPPATVRFEIPTDADATLRIFDARGALVRTLVDAPTPAGAHAVVWYGRNDRGRALGSGIYFVRLSSGREVVTQKLHLAR